MNNGMAAELERELADLAAVGGADAAQEAGQMLGREAEGCGAEEPGRDVAVYAAREAQHGAD